MRSDYLSVEACAIKSFFLEEAKQKKRNKPALTDTGNRQLQKGIARRPRRYAVEELVASVAGVIGRAASRRAAF